MVTSYTQELDKDKTTFEWFTQDLVRGCGGEENVHLPEKVIRSKMETERNSEITECEEKLKAAKNDLSEMMKRSQADWENAVAVENARRRKSHEETQRISAIHERTRKDLQMIARTHKVDDISETTRKILLFGLDQLDVTQSDCEPTSEQDLSWDRYKDETFKSARWTVGYYYQELDRIKRSWKERFDNFDDVMADIRKIFPLT